MATIHLSISAVSFVNREIKCWENVDRWVKRNWRRRSPAPPPSGRVSQDRGRGRAKLDFRVIKQALGLVTELIECSVCWQVGILAGGGEKRRGGEPVDRRFVSDAVAISASPHRLLQAVYLSFSVTVSFSRSSSLSSSCRPEERD